MEKAKLPFISLVVCLILLLPVTTLATADTITCFVSGKGYSIWYDSIVVEPIPEDEGSGVDAFQSYPANPYPVDLAIWSAQTLDFSMENAIANAKQSLSDNGFSNINDIDTAALFSSSLKSQGAWVHMMVSSIACNMCY